MRKLLAPVLVISAIVVSASIEAGQRPLIQASAPDISASPTPQQTEIIVTFRGGEIDDNITAFYLHLMKVGALPTRDVEVRGTSFQDDFFKENVLFAYYPTELNALLATLNRGNQEVKFLTTKSGRGPEPVFGPGPTTVTVPDLKFTEYNYLEVLQLKGSALADVAKDRYLYRAYSSEKDERVPITGDAKKLAEVTRLNPKTAKAANPWKISEGRVLFPAEGFATRLAIPTSLVKQVMAFSRPNVSLTVVALPATKSFAAAPSIPPQPLPPGAGLTCPEPYSAVFNTNLQSINYDLPKGMGLDRLDYPSVIVIDRFPPASAARTAELTYIEEAKNLYEDSAFSDIERRVLLVRSEELGIAEARARDLQQLIATRSVSGRRYDLSEHFEFRDQLTGVTSEIIDPKDTSKIDELQDHGFHVAGIISARCNSYGIAGMIPFAVPEAYSLGIAAPNVLPFQALNDLGATYNCYERPCVINMSWVDTRSGVGQDFIDSITDLYEEYLVVAAAGDERGKAGPGGAILGGPLGRACDLVPACLGDLRNVITVTSFLHNSTGTLDPLANYNGQGYSIVTLAAPGDQIFGSVRGSRFATLSGTSQAAAFVTGAAGLLEAANHRLTPAQIKNRLLSTADLDFNYDGKVAFGKLNVKRALAYNDEDVVNVGTNQPKRGVFDYVEPGSANANRTLFLYREGRDGPADTVGDVKVPRVRRIVKNPGNGYYTVVYESADRRGLKIVRDVTFEPTGKPGHIKDRMTTSFRLLGCTLPRDDGVSVRDWIRKCPPAEKTTQQIKLDEISDLIVRAEAGSAGQ